MKDWKITIIVPVYNVGKYLRQCLDSLTAQTWSNLEILCVNDGSTDDSLAILREYQQRYFGIRVIDKDNGGNGAAVNIGIDHATGKYIGIVEPDDYIAPTMYDKLARMAEEKNWPDVVKAGYWDLFDCDGKNAVYPQLGLKFPSGTIFTIFEHPELLRIHPSVWSCIYRRDFLKKNHIRMIEAPGAGWVDNPFFFQTLCLADTICWLNEPVYYYRQTNTNSSSQLKDCSIPIKRINDICDFLDANQIDDIRIRKELCKRALHYITLIEHNANYTDQNRKDAESMLRRFDAQLVKELQHRKEMDTKDKIPNKIVRFIKSHLKKNGWLYSMAKQIYHGMKYLRNNGAVRTCKQAVRLLRQKRALRYKPLRLPIKSGMRVMLIASDNNRTSGAFLSMVALARLLRTVHHIDAFVILPNQGNGEALLEENHIPFTYVESRDWVIPIKRKRDQKLLEEIAEKRRVNEKAISELQRIIVRHQVDLVHINTTYSYVGAIAALKTSTPFVWHIREFLEEDQENTLWDREKGNELIRQADKVVAISQSIYEKYQKIVPEDRLVCIYNGIDATKFYKPDKRIFVNSVIRFIQIGGFELYKGQIEFSKACARLYADGYRNFEVWFVGTGRQEVRRQVEQILSGLAMNNMVRYWGYQKNVCEYLEQADIAFTCSKSEAFGRTTVEAMLSGNLVIGASSAGTKELIRDGETGILYRQGNDEDLYEKMKTAINNVEWSRMLAKQGQKYMYNHMTAEINAKNIVQLYHSILDKK